MFTNFFVVNFDKKNEYINCERFVLDTYSLASDGYYKKVLTRKNFKNSNDYSDYLNKNNINSIDNRYTSENYSMTKPIGTFLFEFLDMDISKTSIIMKLASKYGITAFYSYHGDINDTFNEITRDDDDSISQEDFEYFYKDFAEDLLYEYQDAQDDFKKILEYVYNLKEKTFLEGLTPSQRYFIFLQSCSNDVRIRLSEYLNNVSLTQDIDYTNLCDLNLPYVTSPKILADLIRKKDKKNHHYNISTFLYDFNNLISAYYYCVLHLIENNIPIKKCKNCGRYFIPENRTSSIYCNRKVEGNKTCKDIGASNTYNEKLKKDEVNALYRKTLSAKKMLANRNPDIPMYLEKYEEWKKTANKYKQDIKNGLKTNEEFKEWIEKTK